MDSEHRDLWDEQIIALSDILYTHEHLPAEFLEDLKNEKVTRAKQISNIDVKNLPILNDALDFNEWIDCVSDVQISLAANTSVPACHSVLQAIRATI